jgi:hypothetical protein
MISAVYVAVLLIKLARVIFLYLNHAIHRHADTSCTLAPHIVNAPSLIANNNITAPLQTDMKARRAIQGALINMRSLCNKDSLLCEFILANSVDFVAVTESWHTGNDVTDSLILAQSCPSGFSFISVPRVSGKGGGLVLFHRKDFKVRLLPNFHSPKSFECASFDFSFQSGCLLVVVIYRPPHLSRTIFESEFSPL